MPPFSFFQLAASARHLMAHVIFGERCRTGTGGMHVWIGLDSKESSFLWKFNLYDPTLCSGMMSKSKQY